MGGYFNIGGFVSVVGFDILKTMLDTINDQFKKLAILNLNEIVQESFNSTTLKDGLQKSVTTFMPELFEYVKKVHEMAILPIAVIVVAYVICLKAIDMVDNKNNSLEIGAKEFLKFFIEGGVALWFMRNAFTFSVASLDLGVWVLKKITNENTTSMFNFSNSMSEVDNAFLVWFISFFVLIVVKIVNVLVVTFLYGHFLQIYLYIGASSIAFATLMKDGWNSIGHNYIKNLFAWALASVFMILVISFAPVVTQSIVNSSKNGVQIALAIGASYVMIFILFTRSHSLAKGILNVAG